MIIKCLYDKLVPLAELKPHPKNRNKHPREQIVRLAKVLNYQGWRYPVKVSKLSGFVTSGHGRIEAARENGWAEVPVNFQDYDTSDQEYMDVQSDNAIALWSELDLSSIQNDLKDLPNLDIDLLGIKDLSLAAIEVLEPGCEEDEVPSVPEEPKTMLGDLYQLGNHFLLCGDSTSINDVERLFSGEKAELCFTSPPYSDQRNYNNDGKDLSTQHLATFMRAAYGRVNYFAVNLGYSRKDGEVNQYWDDYIKEAKDCDLKFLSWNIWDRSGFGFSMAQITAMFAIEYEWVFVFGAKSKELNLTIENKTAGAGSWGNVGVRQKDGSIEKRGQLKTRSHRQLGTIFKSDVARNFKQEGCGHPAMFPVEFPQAYIEAMTSNGEDSVYEPFGGSGTTLIACEKTNRRCFAMELDPHYCDVIVARWEKYSGKTAVRLDG